MNSTTRDKIIEHVKNFEEFKNSTGTISIYKTVWGGRTEYKVYSYSTPILTVHYSKNGMQDFTFNNRFFSMTTRQLQSCLWCVLESWTGIKDVYHYAKGPRGGKIADKNIHFYTFDKQQEV